MINIQLENFSPQEEYKILESSAVELVLGADQANPSKHVSNGFMA